MRKLRTTTDINWGSCDKANDNDEEGKEAEKECREQMKDNYPDAEEWVYGA